MARGKRTLPKSIRGNSTTLTSFKELKKQDSHLIGPVAKYLIARAAEPQERRKDVLHPSELCKPSWCNRRAFYQITQVPETDPRQITYGSERIFEEGHEIHRKWQNWFWDVGTLQGEFKCLHCGWRDWAVAPDECPECGQLRWGLRYLEVPVVNEELHVAGRADGMTDEVFEIKSVGPGTVRFEAPDLFYRWQRNEISLDAMWKEIKRPFPSHIKQGMFYAWVLGRKVIRFLYEWKPNQDCREFTLQVNNAIIDAMVEDAKDVAYAVRTNRLPSRPYWATDGPDESWCKECAYRTHCWSNNGASKKNVRVVRRKREG